MFNPLDIIAPRERQSYVGPSTRYRVTPRHIDWFGLFYCALVVFVVAAIVLNIVAAVV